MKGTECLHTAIRAALAGGRSIMNIYNDPASDFNIRTKGDGSPLTAADNAAHEAIEALLAATAFPVLSEEGDPATDQERLRRDTLWIVDPLDGTKEFISRNGDFTVNIALVTAGIPVAGVIYVPVERRLYYSCTGTGAWRADNIDDTNLPDDLDRLKAVSVSLPAASAARPFTVAASRSHMNPDTAQLIDRLRREHDPVELITAGSSLKICLVAEGSADIYPRFGPTMEWDTAAGHAIAVAAGCSMYDPATGRELRYNKPDLRNPWFIVERPGTR